MPATICQGSAITANVSTANTTQYWVIYGNSTVYTAETSAQIIHRTAGTLSNLQVYVSANTVAGTSTFRLRKNAVNANQLVSVGASTTGKFEDTSGTNSDTVASGDKFCLQTVPGATTNTYAITIISLLYNSSTSTESVTRLSVGAPATLYNTASVTRYSELSGDTNNGIGTESNVQNTQKKAGTFQHLAVNFSANTSTTAGTWTLRKNTANSALTVSITANTSGLFEDTNAAHNVDVVAGDICNHSFVIGTSAAYTFETAQVTFLDASNKTNYLLAGHSAGNTVTLSATAHNPIAGTQVNAAAEPQTQTDINTPMTFSQLSIMLTANTITAASTLRLRKNGANANQTVSITASTTGVFTDTTNVDIIAAGDLVNTQLITGATGTNLNYRWVGVWAATATPTRLYLHQATTTVTGTLPINRHGGSAPTVQGGQTPWADGQPGADTTINRSMNTTIGTSETSTAITSLSTTATQTYYLTKFVSDPLNQTTIAAATWTLNHAEAESSLNANFFGGASLYLYVWRPSTGALVGWLCQSVGAAGYVEPSAINTEKQNTITFTGSALSGISVGDVIIAEIWSRVTAAVAGAYTQTIYYDGTTVSTAANNTTVSDVASFLETPETIAFQALLTRVQSVAADIKYNLLKQVQSSQRTVKYNLVGRIKSLQKTVKYNLLKKVLSLQRTAKYNLLKKVLSLQRTVKYNLIGRIKSLQKTVKYNLLKKILSSQRTVKYNLLKKVLSLQRTAKYNLRLKVLSLQRTVKYNIRKKVQSATRTVKYNLLKKVQSVQRTAKYNLVGRIKSLQKTVKYNLVGRIKSSQRTVKYNLIGRIKSSSRTVKYNILKKVLSSQRTVKYNLRKKILSLQRTVKYNLLKKVLSSQRTVKYNLLKKVQSLSRTAKYNLLKKIQSLQKTVKYNLLLKVLSLPKTVKYSLLTAIANFNFGTENFLTTNLYAEYTAAVTRIQSTAKTGKYSILKQVQSLQKTAKWNLIKRIASLSRTAKYNLLKKVIAQKTLNYNLRKRIQSLQRTVKYNLVGRIKSLQRTAKYNLRLKVLSSAKTAKYNIRKKITVSRTAKWNLLKKVTGLTRTAKYNLLKKVLSSQKTIKYNLVGRIKSLQRTVKYNLIFQGIQRVSSFAETAKWNLRKKVATQKTVKYNLLAKVAGLQKTVKYNLLKKILSSQRTVKYNLRKKIIQSRTLKYNLRLKVVKVQTAKWNIRKFIKSAQRTIVYNLLAQISVKSKKQTIKWNVLKKVAKQGTIVYWLIVGVARTKSKQQKIKYNLITLKEMATAKLADIFDQYLKDSWPVTNQVTNTQFEPSSNDVVFGQWLSTHHDIHIKCIEVLTLSKPMDVAWTFAEFTTSLEIHLFVRDVGNNRGHVNYRRPQLLDNMVRFIEELIARSPQLKDTQTNTVIVETMRITSIKSVPIMTRGGIGEKQAKPMLAQNIFHTIISVECVYHKRLN